MGNYIWSFMNRETRLLQHHKADVTKIVTRKPSDTEGADGDLAVGNTANGVSLFSKINNKWYEFSSNESFGDVTPSIEGSVAYIHGSYATSSTTRFIPLLGTGESATLAASDQGINTMILPYDCRIKSIMLRNDIALGNTYASIYKSDDGANIIVSDATADFDNRIETSGTINVSSTNTAHTLQFSGDYIIPAKSNIAILVVTSTSSSAYILHFVLTLDYDIPV